MLALTIMFNLNSEFPLRDKGVSNAQGTENLPRHRWYFMKEGFSPKLVEQAIATEGGRRGEILLDPFSGGGTVPLTGALAGMKTRSFEVNPFLRFLSATKLQNAEPSAVLKSSRIVSKGLDRPQRSFLEGVSTFTEGNRRSKWLFPVDVLRSYEGGRLALYEVPLEHRDLLQLALLGATMDCCNAVRDGKCLRYLPKWRDNQATRAQLYDHFQRRVKELAEDLSAAPLLNADSRVTEGDARKLIANDPKERFRLCVTSPPYLNSFDYSDVYRPELFLGAFVDSNNTLMQVRLKTLRSHVQASWPAPRKNQFGVLYSKCMAQFLDAEDMFWDPRIPKMVQAYFEDMDGILADLKKRALPSASVWLVVSTSAYAGIEVPVDLILAEIGQRDGWFLREVGVLRYLRSSSQHTWHVGDEARKAVPLRESVVILDAKAR